MNYQQLFEAYKRLDWSDGLMVGLTARWKLEKMFGDKMRLELDAVHKQHFPRRKKINHHNLPSDIVDTIRKKWLAKSDAFFTCAIGRRKWLNRKLSDLAQVTAIEAGECRLMHRVSSGSYGSQGYGATRYARQSAKRFAGSIRAEGFDAEVKEVNGHTSKRWGIYYADYEVWGNLESWQIDAIQRRSKMSLLEWAVACWKGGTNPKVYSPFLPDDIFDKSCAIAMGNV